MLVLIVALKTRGASVIKKLPPNQSEPGATPKTVVNTYKFKVGQKITITYTMTFYKCYFVFKDNPMIKKKKKVPSPEDFLLPQNFSTESLLLRGVFGTGMNFPTRARGQLVQITKGST